MHENPEKLNKLKFGNHRKRRIMDPDNSRGSWTVIRSFVNWVEKHGSGSPYDAFEKHTVDSRSPEDGFDRLYQALKILAKMPPD